MELRTLTITMSKIKQVKEFNRVEMSSFDEELSPWSTNAQVEPAVTDKRSATKNNHSNRKDKDLLETVNRKFPGFDHIFSANSNQVQTLKPSTEDKNDGGDGKTRTFNHPMNTDVRKPNVGSNEANKGGVSQRSLPSNHITDRVPLNGNFTQRSATGPTPRNKPNRNQKGFSHEEEDLVLDDLEDF